MNALPADPSPATRAAARTVAGLFLLVVCGACSFGPDRPPDLLLITVDTLRPDHLGIYGYDRPTSPSLDAFFADGTVFLRAYSTEANTPPSVMSILSGLPPRLHGVRGFYQLADPDVALLPDRLPEAYQSAAFVSNIVLTDEALGIAARFDHYDDFVDEPESKRPDIYERSARRTTDAVLAWLAGSRDPERPLFLWVHYIDPHGPYAAPEEAPRRFRHEGRAPLPPKGKIRAYQIDPQITDVLDYVDRYDEEIAYVDAQVGRLLEGYAARANIDHAFVLFTADHGESMLEHGIWFTHGYHVWEEIMRVPLMMRGPGIAPGLRRSLASGIDVAPTLLAAAGVDVPEPEDPLAGGLDLRRWETPPSRLLYGEASLEGHRWRAGWRGDDKWIFANLGERILPMLHFDLTEDPDELRRKPWFVSQPPDVLTDLVRTDPVGAPQDARPGRQLDAPKIDPRISDAQRRRLEALGYGEGGRDAAP